MSSEAGSAFPLDGLSLIWTHYHPHTGPADTVAAAITVLHADVSGPASPDGPVSQTARLHQQFHQLSHTLPHHRHPCCSTCAHRKSDSYSFIFPILLKPKNICACQQSFVKTLAKSTCKWFVYLRNRNKLLSLVIRHFQNRGPALACKQAHKVLIHAPALPPAASAPSQLTDCLLVCSGHHRKHF